MIPCYHAEADLEYHSPDSSTAISISAAQLWKTYFIRCEVSSWNIRSTRLASTDELFMMTDTIEQTRTRYAEEISDERS